MPCSRSQLSRPLMVVLSGEGIRREHEVRRAMKSAEQKEEGKSDSVVPSGQVLLVATRNPVAETDLIRRRSRGESRRGRTKRRRRRRSKRRDNTGRD
ncbi:hypothetical protein E2C01_016435 [Portunus trituberculatus]|uniref:Uncharacterized protein n=1 Tax=Portunus trituberculatus TaxID=210409 RepID=A0A5B7DPE2_PORTR|nr:hypothetical protein [Portunus trituberculatus]